MGTGLAQRQREHGTSAVQEMAGGGGKTPENGGPRPGPAQPAAPAQPAMPGTQPADAKKKAPEPRTVQDIEHDFRMAVFEAQLVSSTMKFGDGGRELKLDLRVDDGYANKTARDFMKFSPNEPMSIRVLPKQPRLDDHAPEEFGSKIPAFGVEMIERLEKLSSTGRNGWQDMSPAMLMLRIEKNLKEINLGRAGTLKDLQRAAIDIANLSFMAWWNARIDEAAAKRGGK